jgi:hypothetical protein
MTKPKAILTLKGDPVSTSAIVTISACLEIEQQAIFPADVINLSRDRKLSPLIITTNQIKYLASLRLHGFSGGILVLSAESFVKLREKHRILRWSHGSHEACEYPYQLTDILTKVLNLQPLLDTKLKQLQKELKTNPKAILKTKITPCLKRLAEPNCDLERELDTLAIVIRDICDRTPAARHARIEINQQTAQIQEHFRYWIETVRSEQTCNLEQIAILQQVFNGWGDTISQNGEALSLE